MHSLEMPDAFTSISFEGDKTIGEQVVADAVAAIEIKSGGARRNVDDAALDIQGHTSPVIGGPTILPGIFRPGVVTKFAGMRNRVKRPTQLAGAHIVGADVSGRGGQSF